MELIRARLSALTYTAGRHLNMGKPTVLWGVFRSGSPDDVSEIIDNEKAQSLSF